MSEQPFVSHRVELSLPKLELSSVMAGLESVVQTAVSEYLENFQKGAGIHFVRAEVARQVERQLAGVIERMVTRIAAAELAAFERELEKAITLTVRTAYARRIAKLADADEAVLAAMPDTGKRQ